MENSNMIIREIKPHDNLKIQAIIKACFYEFDLPLVGTAFEDEETGKMFESYQNNNEFYLVVADEYTVYGGAGIKPLQDNPKDKKICELQKMYFSPKIRGQGFGKQLFKQCLQKAKQLGYEACYLESALQLKTAIYLYEHFGFKYLQSALGNTGHYSCSVWMLKSL